VANLLMVDGSACMVATSESFVDLLVPFVTTTPFGQNLSQTLEI
jgi:hypothetical protein